MKEMMKQMRMTLIAAFFCFTQSIALAYNDANLPRLNYGEPGHQAGEIIVPVSNEEIAAWCDFSKMIVMGKGGYLCVYNGKTYPQTP